MCVCVCVRVKMSADSQGKKDKDPKVEQALVDEDDDFEEFVTEGSMCSFIVAAFPYLV